jgi:hypothetical protein
MPVEPVLLRPGRPVPRWRYRAWELFAPRLPHSILRLVAGIYMRRPLGSRARRSWLLGLTEIGWDATGRTRLDLVLPIWDPDGVWRWDASFQTLGFDPAYRGHDGVARALVRWNENWTDGSFKLREILDGGDTLVIRTVASGRGVGSGVPVQMEVSSVVRLDPLIVDWWNFSDDAEALREAGFATASSSSGGASAPSPGP